MRGLTIKILVLNSLDERYGSTYRIRALRDLLEETYEVEYVEDAGSALRKLWKALRAARGSYDILFTQKFNPITLAALVMAKLRRKPSIVDWDDIDAGLQGSFAKRWLARFCEFWGPLAASHITTHSGVICERAKRKGRATSIISQGVDLKLFDASAESKAELRDLWGLPQEPQTVGHLCTFTHGGIVDLPLILDAWEKLKDVNNLQFFLIGGGPEEGRVRNMVEKRGLADRTFFSGLVRHDAVPKALQALDVGVVSMSETEANRARVSFKVIEYLAAGTPVVGTVVGETKRLFGQWIMQPAEGGLAEKILEVLAKPPAFVPMSLLEALSWRRQQEPLCAAVAEVLADTL